MVSQCFAKWMITNYMVLKRDRLRAVFLLVIAPADAEPESRHVNGVGRTTPAHCRGRPLALTLRLRKYSPPVEVVLKLDQIDQRQESAPNHDMGDISRHAPNGNW
jgi:hypothetical protein